MSQSLNEREKKLLEIFPEGKLFLAGLNPGALTLRYEGINSPETAYRSEVIKLSEISRAYSRDTAYRFIEARIITLNEFVNIGEERKMDDRQILEVSRYILEDNHFLNIAEVTLVFKRIKKGEYGEFYGRIDGPTILRCFREYRKERGKAVSKVLNEKQLSMPSHERAAGIMKILKDRLGE